MTSGGVVAAVDLGATSGRVMLGYVEDGMLRLEQVARFPNGPVPGPDGSLRWDFTALYRHIADGLVHTAKIDTFLRYPKPFPVDIRHNAKIGREKLAAWAATQAIDQASW